MANSEEKSTFTHFRITKSQSPFPVKLHCLKAVTWKNSIIVLGGFAGIRDEVTHDPGSVCYYHCSGKWLRQETLGNKPPRHFCNGNVVEVLNDKIVVVVDGTFYSLCLFTWTWTILDPGGQPPPGVPFDCRYMSSWVYNERIYIFGGYGVNEEFEITYSNHLSCYNPSTNNWELVHQSGDIPSPRRGQVTTIAEDTVFLFGGHNDNHHQDSPHGELYMLDMNNLHWTRIHEAGPIGPSNHGRFYMSSTLTLISKSRAVVFSSLPHADNDEVWILDIDRAKHLDDPAYIWKQIPNHFRRSSYTALKDPLSESVWLIGGFDGNITHNDPTYGPLNPVTSDILKISPHSLTLRDLATDYIARNMSTEEAKLLPDQIPQEIVDDIALHRRKCC